MTRWKVFGFISCFVQRNLNPFMCEDLLECQYFLSFIPQAHYISCPLALSSLASISPGSLTDLVHLPDLAVQVALRSSDLRSFSFLWTHKCASLASSSPLGSQCLYLTALVSWLFNKHHKLNKPNSSFPFSSSPSILPQSFPRLSESSLDLIVKAKTFRIIPTLFSHYPLLNQSESFWFCL